jgi:hypothetical protein
MARITNQGQTVSGGQKYEGHSDPDIVQF